MPKYMITGSYTAEGARGLLKEGASGRLAAVRELAKSAGGSVEAAYFAFGKTDIFVVVDVPDAAAAAAISITVGAAGSVKIRTIPLLSVEEVDAAARKSIAYRPPGA